MKHYGVTQLAMNVAALAIMWCASVVLIGLLAAAAWALLKFGWGMVY